MNQREALRQTIQIAAARGYGDIAFDEVGVDMQHLNSMMERVDADYDPTSDQGFSEGKLGRWLGYAQGVLVANAILSLEECKEINRGWAGR